MILSLMAVPLQKLRGRAEHFFSLVILYATLVWSRIPPAEAATGLLLAENHRSDGVR